MTGHHRKDRLAVFLAMAKALSQLSPDEQTQHACLIVDTRFRVLGCGFNGFPRGLVDTRLPKTRPEKYPWMIHAEVNAVSNCIVRPEGRGATAVVTGAPCNDCLMHLWQNGVERVLHLDAHGSFDGPAVRQEFLTASGMDVRAFPAAPWLDAVGAAPGVAPVPKTQPAAPLTADQQRLVTDNLPLVYWVMEHHLPPHAMARYRDRNDVVQAGVLGLIKAAGRFDPGRGFKFVTYATFWVASEIRKGNQMEHTIYKPRTKVSRGGNVDAVQTSDYMEAVIPAQSDAAADAPWQAEEIDHWLRVLSPQEREVLRRRFLLDETYDEVAVALKISRARAHAVGTIAIQKLRKRHAKKESA